jgi:3-methylcrotonyl-CoA carboxylase alpha subunit
VRVDTGIVAGDAVTIHYDPMIAKLIVWDRDREAALARLRDALRACEIVGLASNLAFLSALAAHPAFAKAELDTGFIGRHLKALVPPLQPASDRVLALAILALMLQRQNEAASAAQQSPDPHSPWHRANGWRLNDDAWHVVRLRDPGSGEMALTVHFRTQGFVVDLPSGEIAVRGTLGADGRVHADLRGVRIAASVIRRNDELTVIVGGASHTLHVVNPITEAESGAVDTGRLTAPMPGKIVAVRVAAGQAVKRGAPLLVLEAMKMEHTITAPADGTVERVRYAVGDQVDEGAELVGFKAA